MRNSLIEAWLRRNIDPKGPRGDPSGFDPSRNEMRQLLARARAHHVLPTVLQNIAPFADRPGLEVTLAEANSYRIELLAHATMLNHYGERILRNAQGLPVIMVKGAVFARTIYPQAALRPFTDIDLLVDLSAIPRLNVLLRDEGFTMVEDGAKDGSMLWAHRSTGALVEVHGDLVHMQRLRDAFSLTYDVIAANPETPAALLTVAIIHGTTHYYAWLKYVVDLCQAARAVSGPAEEARLEALTARTRTRFPAILGLMLAYRLMDEPRCLELAKALGPIQHAKIAELLCHGADLTAITTSWFVYNSWRRFVFRELLRYGAMR
jgi:hypothetical protein